ncbi:hypothetical protein PR001_g10187 [Phytophthora rubi]|uniref:EF-hand domain-containing protein n=1 Tax=Phytophthora rubi TaxID=129364 RepID=A0A6A3MKW5_9STRA|nr:hypothetical protein PR001_g10187 [Phytophthora rubi]
MESRVSTAPGPKAKRWPKNPGSSHLLRNVKSLKGDSSFLEASAEENRPQTCPALTLTPRLHWNLNNSALNMLPKRQVEELYGLFKFYDSSTIGDALPSINCTRFMEILRDAGLLRSDNNDTGTSSTVPLMEGLWAKNVEKIFAQAAMGKMRVYLDADDQPALTFSLFCGAIMNCAMLLIPSEHPVNALYQILPTLLECSLGNEHHASAAKGLLGHLPTDGSLSCWIPGRSHASLPRPEDAQQDFRDLPSFQQVIADCESDKVFEELRKEEMAKRYQVPDRLLASFEHDTIALISDKFRLFDVSERGVLPRHEIFALLSGLGKRADLPDPYSVLPRLFASKNPMETNQSSAGITSGCEMTLAELLEAVEVTREAKRHSSAARLASIKIHLNRTATTARNSLSFEGSADDNNQSVLDLYDLPEQNKSTTTEGSKDVKERGRRRGVLKSRKSTLSQASDSDVPIRSARASRGSKTHLTHHPSTSNRRKAVLPRRSSSINSNKAETMISATADLLNQVEPECREHSGGKDPTVVEANFLDMNTSNRDEAMKAPSTLQLVPDTDHESQLQCPPSAITIEVYEPPSASNRTTIRIFLLLGGDHDGAICSTISLVFATKEITESEGIYYAAGPNEITRTGPFHWNLNNSALKTLTQNQVNQLYGLFKFYDSSAIGDDLPSINCARLVEILRDARLISESSIRSSSVAPSTRGLQVENVERIFAQAVMGKMRVYLDADGQPALTFPLFCGALMNCAMVLTPLTHPEAALRQILPILLDGSIGNGHHGTAGKGILGHLPKHGTISLWMSGQHQSTDDFRETPPFQQVIADCTRDKVLEELKQEKLARCYQIPDRLLASFHHDTIALISTKFRMFDVFDRGTVPRQEVFPLLSSVGKRADLPDPYAVLAKLSASSSEINGDSGDMTLAQLVQAIEATRDSKRHSITARLAAMKVNNQPLVDPAATEGDSTLDGALTPHVKENVSDATGLDHTTNSAHNHGSTGGSVSKERKKLGVPRSKSRRSIISQSSGASSSSSSSHSLISSKHRGGSKNRLTHHASTSGKKKTELQRNSSIKDRNLGIVTTDLDSHGSVIQSMESGSHSQRSNNTDSSDYDHDVTETTGSFTPRSDDFSVERRSSRHFEHNGHSSTVSTQVHEPSNKSKTLRMFLLLGGDHDGAICCTLSLKLATREIVESEGTYYSTAPSEITRTMPVLPTQNGLANALLLLKKCVSIKQELGFELRPANQLVVVDEMLLELKKREPRFSIALKPGVRASLTAASTVSPSSANPTNTVKVVEDGGVSAASSLDLIPALKIESRPISSSLSLGQKPLSLPKPAYHHQYEVPSNYREIVATWEVSMHDDHGWIHAVNAASPLKPASPLRTKTKPHRSGHLSPLRLPHRQDL